jgi:hypothetical protein
VIHYETNISLIFNLKATIMISPVEMVQNFLDLTLKEAAKNGNYLLVLKEFEKSVINAGALSATPDRYVTLLRRLQQGEHISHFPDFGAFRKSGDSSSFNMTGVTSVLMNFPLEGYSLPDNSFLKVFLPTIRKDRGGRKIAREVSAEILEKVDFKGLDEPFNQMILLFYLSGIIVLENAEAIANGEPVPVIHIVKEEIYPDIIQGLKTKQINCYFLALKKILQLLDYCRETMTGTEAFVVYGTYAECVFRWNDMDETKKIFELFKDSPIYILRRLAMEAGVTDFNQFVASMEPAALLYNIGVELRQRQTFGHVAAFTLAAESATNYQLKSISQCSVGTGLLQYVEMFSISELIPDAEKELDKALHLDEKDWITYSGLAVVHMLKDDRQKAVWYAQKAMAVNPRASGAKRVMSKYLS